MKVWSAIFNFIAIWIMIIMIGVFYNHMDAIQTDYDTAVLRQVIEYAGEAAFNTAIKSGDNAMGYTNLGNVTLDPRSSLKAFENMVCLSYGMSINDENRAHIESYIPSAMLCTYDGYYITQLMDNSMAELQWSVKFPYTMPANSTTADKKYTEEDAKKKEYTLALRIDSEKGFIIANDTTNGVVEDFKTYGDLARPKKDGGYGIQHSEINREKANIEINTTITDALSYNIAKVSEYRGGKNYRIYLPADTTFSGINTINGPSLIILLNGGDFAGKAKVSEAAISGLKVVARNWVVGYKDNGKNLYCYSGQLTEAEMSGGSFVVTHEQFETVQEAAKAGYYPDYVRLARPINQ